MSNRTKEDVMPNISTHLENFTLMVEAHSLTTQLRFRLGYAMGKAQQKTGQVYPDPDLDLLDKVRTMLQEWIEAYVEDPSSLR